MAGKKGGWRGKTMVFYTLKPEAYDVQAVTIFGDKEIKPNELVKKAWDFVKANAFVEKKMIR